MLNVEWNTFANNDAWWLMITAYLAANKSDSICNRKEKRNIKIVQNLNQKTALLIKINDAQLLKVNLIPRTLLNCFWWKSFCPKIN